MRVDIWSDVVCPFGYTDEVRQDEAQAQDLGISGVPFFVFDMRLAVSGAQPTGLFTQARGQARQPQT